MMMGKQVEIRVMLTNQEMSVAPLEAGKGRGSPLKPLEGVQP